MRQYKIREGVILLKIHSVYLLASDARAWKFCPYIIQTDETGAFIWNHLLKGFSLDEIVMTIQKEYEVDTLEHVRYDVQTFIQKLLDFNYLIIERQD